MPNADDSERIARLIRESIQVKQALIDRHVAQIAQAADWMIETFGAGGKVLLCGNGGSAGDAQHIAAELVGRFERTRGPLPALALTTNSSTLTAIANDYDYRQVFSRQVEAWADARDLVIGISTSGNSPNVIEAMGMAKRKGTRTLGLTGQSGGRLASCVDLCITVPSENTARIQEAHILIGHILCHLVDASHSRAESTACKTSETRFLS